MLQDTEFRLTTRQGPPSGSPPNCPGYLVPLAVLLCLAAIVPVWMCEYFPSHNAPALLSVAQIASHYHDPHLGYAEYYEVHLFPVPYLFQFGIMVPFLSWFGPQFVLKLLVTVVIVLRCGAIFYFLRQVGPGRAIYGLAWFALVYDFVLLRGYFNCHAAISLGLIVFGYYLRHRDRWTAQSICVLNVLVLLVYFAHPLPLVLTGALLAVYELAVTRSLRPIPGLVARGFVPSIALLFAFLLWSRAQSSWTLPEIEYAALIKKLMNVHYRGPTSLSALANWGALGLWAVLGGIWARRTLRAGRESAPSGFAPKRGTGTSRPGEFLGDCDESLGASPRFWGKAAPGSRSSPLADPWLAVWLGSVLLYLVMPSNLVGWHKADLHVLPVCFVFLLSLPPALRSRRSQAVFCGLVTVIFLAGIVPQIRGLTRASDEIREYVAGIPTLPQKSKLLSLHVKEAPDSDWGLERAFNPVQWADSYYTIERGGGQVRGLIANNTLYPVWFKDYRAAGKTQFPEVDVRNPTAEQLDRAATTYRSVVLWNDDSTFRRLFESRDFDVAFQQGRLCVLTRSPASPGQVSYVSGPPEKSEGGSILREIP